MSIRTRIQIDSGSSGEASDDGTVLRGKDKIATRYDGLTIVLHWTTAGLVVVLYALAQTWGFLPKGTLRFALVSLHVSLGLVLTAVLTVRIFWRLGFGRQLKPATTGMVEAAAKAVQYLLYSMLTAQTLLGWGFLWALATPLALFGLFVIPAPIAFTHAQGQMIELLHHWIATLIILAAGGHALAALFHHYALRDAVLARMLPAHRKSTAETAGRSDQPAPARRD
jgi:cytochrome b561